MPLFVQPCCHNDAAMMQSHKKRRKGAQKPAFSSGSCSALFENNTVSRETERKSTAARKLCEIPALQGKPRRWRYHCTGRLCSLCCCTQKREDCLTYPRNDIFAKLIRRFPWCRQMTGQAVSERRRWHWSCCHSQQGWDPSVELPPWSILRQSNWAKCDVAQWWWSYLAWEWPSYVHYLRARRAKWESNERKQCTKKWSSASHRTGWKEPFEAQFLWESNHQTFPLSGRLGRAVAFHWPSQAAAAAPWNSRGTGQIGKRWSSGSSKEKGIHQMWMSCRELENANQPTIVCQLTQINERMKNGRRVWRNEWAEQLLYCGIAASESFH